MKAAAKVRESLPARLAGIFVDASEDEQLRLRKTVLLFASGGTAIAAFVWLGLYWALKLPTTMPLLYQVLTALIVGLYLRTRKFDFYMVAQLALFLFAPFIVQWSVGSFVNSGGVMLFALLAPAGAMLVYGLRESAAWFAVYIVLVILSMLFDYYGADGSFSGLTTRTVVCLFAINLTMLSSIVYLLTRYLVRHKATYLRLKKPHDFTPPRRLVLGAKDSLSANELTSKQPQHPGHRAPSGTRSAEPHDEPESEWNALTREAELLQEKSHHPQAILVSHIALRVAERKRGPIILKSS